MHSAFPCPLKKKVHTESVQHTTHEALHRTSQTRDTWTHPHTYNAELRRTV